jgi:protoporphyrinogen oxidase
MKKNYDVIIVGAGITGLTAARDLVKAGKTVCIVEAESQAGGLASTFLLNGGIEIEKFYHHWFNSDQYIMSLIDELKLANLVTSVATNTGLYFNKRIWKLSSPVDLLRFKALSFADRIRLGLLVFKVKRIKDWRELENLSIRDWLEPLSGAKVYEIVWEPLIKAKFANFATEISAVWMWKKLDLRGGTRKRRGAEELLYIRGGFNVLIKRLMEEIESNGGTINLSCAAIKFQFEGEVISSLKTQSETITAQEYIVTTAFPIVNKLVESYTDTKWKNSLVRVNYLGNICLVLRLQHSLSNTYWLNVNDPEFPFVGVIEHTNFEDESNYANSHIVYLSRYISTQDKDWKMNDEKYFENAFKNLNRMFPKLDKSWVIEYKIWRAEYSQPVVEKNYTSYLPSKITPISNLMLSNMAHIYPEDRGTNFAVRDGKEIARIVLERISRKA